MRQKAQKLWQFLFGDSARAFGTLSVVLLVCLAIAPAKDRFREWTRYQAKYLRLIRGRGEAASLAASFPGRIAADLDARTGGDGPLRHLSSGPEGSQPLGREHATVPAASAHPALADRVRMRDVPPRPGRRHGSGGSASQHTRLGTTYSAGALFGSRLRPVPLEHRSPARRN